MSEPSLIQRISDEQQAHRGWVVHVNGERIEPVHDVSIAHPRFGTLSYGLTPHGYDGWVFREIGGGGGVALLVHTELEGELYVLVVEQDRPNQGGPALNLPRGFVEPGEDVATAARRELAEETGLELEADRFEQLAGAAGNPNSAFFDTRGDDGGVRFFAVRLEPGELPDRGRPPPADDERLGGVKLLPWYEVAGLGDMISNAGVARLLASRQGAASSSS